MGGSIGRRKKSSAKLRRWQISSVIKGATRRGAPTGRRFSR